MAFNNSSGFTITGGRFTHVVGDQHINHVQGDLVQYLGREERVPTIWDEYTRVPTGRVYIVRTVGDTTVRRDHGETEYVWKKIEARRNISIVKIQGEDTCSHFVYVRYSGRDCFEAFQRDFEEFSHVKNANVVQLFGYNDSQSFPALLFYEELVPVAFIFERNNFSSLLYTYFEYQFGVDQLGDDKIDFGDLWVHARSGHLRTGPYVKYASTRTYFAAGFETNTENNGALSIQAFSDPEAVFDYLRQFLSTHDILRGIAWSNQHTTEWLEEEEAVFVFRHFPGTIYRWTSREVIARWPVKVKEWFYGIPSSYHLPEDVLNSGYCLNNLSLRWRAAAESWLSQAHCVLNYLGIEEKEWRDCFILGALLLDFERSFKPSQQIRALDRPLYLFIRPIPSVSQSQEIWSSWAKGNKCYWSFDIQGKEEMSEATQASLNLPTYKCRLGISHNWWDPTAQVYNAVKMLHLHNGFDPSTPSLSKSLDLPIYELDENHPSFDEIRGPQRYVPVPRPLSEFIDSLEGKAKKPSGARSTSTHNSSSGRQKPPEEVTDSYVMVDEDTPLEEAWEQQQGFASRLKGAFHRVFSLKDPREE
ncbi:hypothetical protein VNI00_015402 [Paramarasmius palmivorus]|uniref:Uncharacterized protein n=1 Tax=Paramarasmius palmivorus TaxID=297713 RepID=A0AAW0BKP7_9AGAR